jgi:E3 ubiquitin-protein ligase DOA10
VIVELGFFPSVCGVVIDLCIMPVFGESVSFQSRLKFFSNYPYTFGFIHWLIGTTFMFQFAVYVATIREILRPGVFWFIRDPNDVSFFLMLA